MKYDKLFQSLPAGIYAAPRLAGPLRAAAKRAGIAWYDLGLKGVADRQALLRRCAEAFSLPAHFGKNWDALHECLRELAGGGTPGAIVHWRRGPELARRRRWRRPSKSWRTRRDTGEARAGSSSWQWTATALAASPCARSANFLNHQGHEGHKGKRDRRRPSLDETFVSFVSFVV